MNAWIGNNPVDQAVGLFGEYFNDNGHWLVDLAVGNEFKITNSFFKKKDIYKYTYSARQSKSVIKYVVANHRIRQVQDIQV